MTDQQPTPVALAKREIASEREMLTIGQEIESFEILTDEDQEVAADVLRGVKEKSKEVEERRKLITDPLNRAKREVDALFRPLRTALAEAEAALKSKIAAYQLEKEERNAQRLLEAAQAESWQEAEQTLAETEAHSSPKGINVRFVWKPVVVNALEVPRKYLSVDVGKLEAVAKGAKSEPGAIPGVRWEKKSIVSSRRVTS